MKTRKVLCRVVVSAAAMLLAGNAPVRAQNTETRSRVVAPVDNAVTVRLQGNVHPAARPAYDQGALPDSQPITHMMLLLQRSTEQEQTLRQLLDAQQTQNSGSYHAWLTPDQFGKQFGPSDADVQAVTSWLTQQGFQIRQVNKGRTLVEFDGIVGQIRSSFHTEIHRFAHNNEVHFANVSDPAIPQALSPVVRGVVGLNNFPKRSQVKQFGNFHRDGATGQVKPLFTFTDTTGTYYALGPADFAKIYNFPTGWPNVGSGASIAIAGQSNINLTDIASFQSMFGLSSNPPTVIVNGPDPGLIGPNTLVNGAFPDDEQESDLDVEWAGALAPQASIIFVTSQTTDVTGAQGVDLSALYIVDNNLAGVLSESYGACEASLGTSGNIFYNSMWQQASAEGITVVIAAGDTGSANCDPYPSDPDPNAANQGLAVNGIASPPYVVAVGGTDFNQKSSPTTYWSAPGANGAGTYPSALGYIPETVWDESTCAANYLETPATAPCTSVDTSGEMLDLTAGGGGASNCITVNGSGNCVTLNNSTSCSTTNVCGYPKPPFQNSLTPADGVRDIPDVSLFASPGFNGSFYIVCQSDANVGNALCNLTVNSSTQPADEDFIGVGGTSAATPSFAAIMALVDSKTGQRQGNADYQLYLLAANAGYPTPTNCNSSSFTNPANPAPASCVFYDITQGTNTVACDATSLNCSNNVAGYGVLVSPSTAYSAKPPNNAAVTEGNPGFTAVTGYDLASGLGSVNVANLLANWGTVNRTATTTQLSSASATTVTSGTTNFSVTISVSQVPPNGEPVALVAYASDQKTILGSVGAGTSNASSCVPSSQNPDFIFLLCGGTVRATTNLLPPGTAYIQGTYGGDAKLAMSASNLLALTVNGSNSSSKTTLSFVTYNSSGQPVLSTGSQNVQYGSPYILEIAVSNNSNNQQCASSAIPCPVGNIALTDNGNALNDWPNAQNANATNIAKLNNQGIAEDQPIQLGVGSHSLLANFTPSSTSNTNYAASQSNTLSVTITQASTTTLLSGPSSISGSGASATFTAYITTNSSGNGPTGSVSFTSNGSSIGSATCTPTSGQNSINPPIQNISLGSAYCTATLTANISALYPPSGKPGMPSIPRIPALLALLSLLLFIVGLRWIPQTRRRAYTFAGLLVIALLVGVVAGCGGGGGGGGGSGTRNIVATYPGDTNYTGSNGSFQLVVQ